MKFNDILLYLYLLSYFILITSIDLRKKVSNSNYRKNSRYLYRRKINRDPNQSDYLSLIFNNRSYDW